MKRNLTLIIIFFFIFNCGVSSGQNFISLDKNLFLPSDSIKQIKGSSNPALPLAIGIASFLYIFNPIFIYEDEKLSAGLTKEFSIGFGYFGEHRLAVEYSYIFRKEHKHLIRFSYKYDYLLNRELMKSNMLQTSGVFSFGFGYFTNFDNEGIFPEISYGYSIRNHKLLIFPHIKARYIYIFQNEKSNIIDFSTGITVGFANPFIDMKIRRKHY